MVHVFHQIPFEMPSGMLFAGIYERETRCFTVYILTHAAFDSTVKTNKLFYSSLSW